MIYTPEHKMCQLMQEAHQVLLLINRFGMPLGVGDKTIKQVCAEQGVDCITFLVVVNFAISVRALHNYVSSKHIETNLHRLDYATLMQYVRNGHTYFLEFRLPKIRHDLLNALKETIGDHSVGHLIIKFFDEYVAEISEHISHENLNEFQYHQEDDEHILEKLIELKSLIIKYYPNAGNDRLFAVLHDLGEIEEELQMHCAVEDELVIPILKTSSSHVVSEELSQREKDVLIELVSGLSNKEIANHLNISTHTVISHRKNIANKLHIHSVAGLTIYAIVNGLYHEETKLQ